MLGCGAVDLAKRITDILSPHLGAMTADAVARHLLAKHELLGAEAVAEPKASELRETIRKGLVAFVGAERAAALAADCLPPARI